MADKFTIEAKLKITGVDVKGDLNAGTLKFKVDTSALQKLVSDAGIAAKKVKAKFDKIKLNKLKIEVNKSSLKTIESQIRRAVQNAVKKTKLSIQTSVAGGTKADPFKAQRIAAGKSAQSLQTLHNLTKLLNQGFRSLSRTLASIKPGAGTGAGAAKGNLPFPAGARTVSVGSLGGGGGGGGGRAGPGAPPGGAGRGGGGIRDLGAALGGVTTSAQNANKELVTLEELTFQVGKKAAAFRGVAIAINTIVTASQAAVKFVIDFNDSLIEVNKILQLTDDSLNKLGDDLFALSAKTGVAVDQTIAISETFARAGLSGRGYGTIVELTNRALTGMQGTTLDASQATELFVQIIQQVEGGVRGLGKELVTTAKLFDVLGKAEDITASKATDVQAAFKRSAASIFATGVTIEEATTLISVLQERTQRGGDVIGTALKTMAARISSSTSEATKALNTIGVSTIDAQGNLRNLFDVLQDTAVAFQGLTESEQANVAVKAAGIRQVEIFRSAVRDFSRMQDVNTQLVNASGDAARKQAAEQKKLINVISKLQIAFQKLIKTASEGFIGESFVFILTVTEKLFTAISNLDKIIGGAVSTFAALVTIGLGLKVLIPMLGGIRRAMAFFIGAQKESAVGMTGIQRGAQSVATTIQGQMNPALTRTTTAVTAAMGQMQALGAATLFAASQAERLAAAQGKAFLASSAGQAGVARRGEGNRSRGLDVVQTAGVAGGGAFLATQKKVGIFGKSVNGVSRGLKSMGKNVLLFGAIASIAGGALQSLADGLRKEGSTGLGGAADIGGGVLGGAGIGAAIGTLVAGPLGAAIGAGAGAIIGSLKPLARTFGGAGEQIDDLRKRYIELGIVQSENGEITSEVAQKLDKALRNLTAFQNFELGLDEQRIKDLFDPEGAGKRREKVEKERQTAQKGLEAGFDRNASATEQNARVFAALSKGLRARTGEQAIDLSAPELLKKGAPVLGEFGETTLREIQTESRKMADAFGIAREEIDRIFNEEIARAKSKPLTRDAIQAVQNAINTDTTALVEALDAFIPAGKQISDAAREQANKFKSAIAAIAEGEGGAEAEKIIKETLAKVQVGKGFRSAQGDFLSGTAGRGALGARAEQARGLATRRQNVGVQGVGVALPDILKRLGPLLGGGVGAAQSARSQERVIKGQERVAEAFDNLRTEFPLQNIGKFIDRPVNKLEVILRDFTADFGREINKLSEAQLRATTPQEQLADALAKSTAESAKFVQRRVRLEKADALQRSKVKFQTELTGGGERQFGDPDALRALFKAAEDIELSPNIEANLAKTGKSLQDLLTNASAIDVGKIFEVDEATASKIKEAFARTTGGALQELFQVLLDANRRISDEKIIDPDKQRAVVAEAKKSVDLTGVNDKQIKAVTDNVLELTQGMVKLDTEALQALIKSNSAAVTALKQRISEEERLLALDRRRREATALNARAITQELTGIRSLVAQRQIEAGLADANITASRRAVSVTEERISSLRQVEQTEGKTKVLTDQIAILQKKRVEEALTLEEQLGNRRITTIRDALQVANLALSEGRKVGNAERKRIGTLASINSLLSVDRTQMQKFNAELATLGTQFKTSQAELAAETMVVNATIQDETEKKARLADIQKRGAALALEQAKAEAQVIAKRREAIKQVAEELLGNQGEQVEAQKAVIDATKGVSEAFEGYLQAVDGAILATTRYNLGLEMASLAATKVTGGFTGLTDEIGAVQDAFRSAEDLARQMGASEKTLVEIRRESVNQQLAMFNQLLADQTQAARSFFTSSAQDQAALFQGIQEAQGIASLLGGSFDEFKKKGDNAINALGAQILALPQETRQRIQEAIGVLSTTGGTVGGFTADQLQTALDEAVFGRPTEGGPLQVDPIIAVQEKIAKLTEEQAMIATEQLISSQEQVVSAKEQLEVAEAAKDLAEILLERVKEDGERLRGKMGELQGQLNTTLLQQDQTARSGFQSVTSAVARAASDVINKLPDAFSVKVAEAVRELLSTGGIRVPGGAPISESTPTAQTRGKESADMLREVGRNRSTTRQAFSQGGNGVIVPVDAAGGATTGRPSTNPNDPSASQTNRTLNDILSQLKDLNTVGDASLEATSAIVDNTGNAVGTANAVIGGGGQPEITINVEGTSTVTVTGFEAGVARIAAALTETFGGFATEEEARQIANEVLDNIRTELLRRGIITLTTL